jgi:hypothetical protein
MKKDKLEEDTFDYSEIEDEIKEAKLSQRKEDFEMFEKILNEWATNNSFKYDDECSYCQRNINDWIIKVRELKQKLRELK